MKIDKNIPFLPYKRSGAKYPWAEMEIGDSIFFISKDKSTDRKIATAALQWGRRNNRKFAVRKINKKGFRVWRIK